MSECLVTDSRKPLILEGSFGKTQQPGMGQSVCVGEGTLSEIHPPRGAALHVLQHVG